MKAKPVHWLKKHEDLRHLKLTPLFVRRVSEGNALALEAAYTAEHWQAKPQEVRGVYICVCMYVLTPDRKVGNPPFKDQPLSPFRKRKKRQSAIRARYTGVAAARQEGVEACAVEPSRVAPRSLRPLGRPTRPPPENKNCPEPKNPRSGIEWRISNLTICCRGWRTSDC